MYRKNSQNWLDSKDHKVHLDAVVRISMLVIYLLGIKPSIIPLKLHTLNC